MAENETPITADEARKRYGSDVFVSLPDGGTWHCRRPDIKTLIVDKLVPMPLVMAAMADIQAGTTVAEMADREEQGFGDLVKLWITLAAKSPRIVMHEAEAGPDALWIRDVPVVVRMAIFIQTLVVPDAGGSPATVAFPAEPAGANAARDGAELRDATERAPASAGSA